MQIFKSILLLIIVCGILCSSCKKMIDVGLPKNQLVTESVFSDSVNAIGAVSGIYAEMMNVSTSLSFGNGSITAYTGLAADELFTTAFTNAAENEFQSNGISIENAPNNALWLQAYKLIYQTNACIDGLTNSKNITPSLKDQLLGECRVIRSLLYFNLVNLFGAVPYVTTINYTQNAILPRMAKEEVMARLLIEVSNAREQLSTHYPSGEKVRFNKMAATAFLAKLLLYEERWAEAEAMATAVISSAMYSLEPVLNAVFLAGSKEAILQLRPIQPNFNTAEGQIFNPTSSASVRPRYALSNGLLLSFEPGDNRRVNGNWMRSKVVTGQTFWYPHKYKLRSDANPVPSEYYIVFRLAEQYLIRSEARAMQDKLILALADLNLIRQRAGLPVINSGTSTAVLLAIEQEKRVEFFAEGGHRWFDLKRWDRANAVFGISKAPNWQSTDQLFPIPLTELNRNPYLVQNPGY